MISFLTKDDVWKEYNKLNHSKFEECVMHLNHHYQSHTTRMQLHDIMEVLVDVLERKLISYTTMNACPKLVTKHSEVVHIRHFMMVFA